MARKTVAVRASRNARSAEDSYSIGLCTPYGWRRLEIRPYDPNQTLDSNLIMYDERNGTRISELYGPEDVEIGGNYVQNYPLYDPSDDICPLTGRLIAQILWPRACLRNYWLFDDCVVVPGQYSFEVYMAGENGGIVCQLAVPDPDSIYETIRSLDLGHGPIGKWEDGSGRIVCPKNGKEVYSPSRVLEYLHNFPLDDDRRHPKPWFKAPLMASTMERNPDKTWPMPSAQVSPWQFTRAKVTKSAQAKPKAPSKRAPARKPARATSRRR